MSNHEMDFVGHLGELRKRLIIVVCSFILFLMLSFIFIEDVYKWLIKGVDMKLAVLGPSEIVWVYLMIASVVALTATIPIAAHQLWLFVRPALMAKEQKVTMAYIPALFILFLFGISFGYFVIFPIVFDFLMSLSEEMFMTFFTTEKYFKFLLHMTVPFGFLFELPVVMMFLTSLGVVNPYQLQQIRKHAYFVLIVTAVIITPPDILSDILVIIPLLLLYECSILLSKLVYKRKQDLSEAA